MITNDQIVKAECIVIGSIMADPDKFYNCFDLVSAEDFIDPTNKLIFECMVGLVDSSQAIDIFSIADYLQAAGIGGKLEYLTDLNMNTVSANYISYARVVQREAFSRRAINKIDAARQEICGLTEIMDIEASLALIPEGLKSKEKEFKPFDDQLRDCIKQLERRFNGEDAGGLKVGYKAIDERLLGIGESDLMLLAARPSMGKTALAMNIIENICLSGGRCIVFTLEMDDDQLLQRMLASVCGIHLGKLRKGNLDQEDWVSLEAGVGKMKKIKDNLLIINESSMHYKHVSNIVKKMSRKKKYDLVMIDYIQLLKGDSSNRTEEMAQVSRGLKSLAKTSKTPVLGLAQLNRDLEKRPNKRPVSSDLRECGQFEQDADQIIMLYRDEYYNENSDQKGICEVISRKVRNGECGTDYLETQLHMSRMKDTTFEYKEPSQEGKSQPYRYGK